MEADKPIVVQLRHEFAIVSEKNETIATATVERMHEVLWLNNVWVHGDHRRKGLGRRIVTTAVHEFSHEDIWLNVYPYTSRPLDTEQLSAFYASFGFVSAGSPGSMVRKAAQ